MRIEQLMSRPAVTCRPNDTLNTAAGLMWDHDIGALPVVTEDGRVVGILTDRDICMAGYLRRQPLHEIPVSVAMAKEVLSCFPQEFVDAAERVMSKAQVRRVPVVDADNRLLGILSLSDLVRHAASMSPHDGFDRTLVLCMAAVCQARARPAQLVRIVEQEPAPTGM